MRERDRQTDRDRETERQTDKRQRVSETKTERQTDRDRVGAGGGCRRGRLPHIRNLLEKVLRATHKHVTMPAPLTATAGRKTTAAQPRAKQT